MVKEVGSIMVILQGGGQLKGARIVVSTEVVSLMREENGHVTEVAR